MTVERGAAFACGPEAFGVVLGVNWRRGVALIAMQNGQTAHASLDHVAEWVAALPEDLVACDGTVSVNGVIRLCGEGL